ncbi:class I SAM-dependent methyltransferase [Mycolicibacterium sp. F2034L]|uniref:class I SAM-dependent methyltransferase n=1 Tax=Mycolicibacterium sp. F2034L TaxID=2926422 RepID=UPI001FF5F900|nr:class I SAM-dependent methyltransferase [Mycolicibacterium sp. F2034L]MCK0173778.1 class I SAM-dependent methyltransferase [Mycolicibacterium sp. F2034L]
MKSAHLWQPSKYDYLHGKQPVRGSRDTAELSPSSRLITDRVAQFYARVIPKYSRGDLLDLGCGKAPLYGLYRHYSDSTMCADWENSLHENALLDEFVDLNMPLKLSSAQYDTIILSDVLEHVQDPMLLMREVARMLKPGGFLLMNVPFMYWLHEIPHDYHRFTSFALERMCEVSGLEVKELDAIGGAPEVLSDLLAKQLVQVPAFGGFIAAVIQWAANVFTSRSKVGRFLSEKTAATCPLGYALVAAKPMVGTAEIQKH